MATNVSTAPQSGGITKRTGSFFAKSQSPDSGLGDGSISGRSSGEEQSSTRTILGLGLLKLGKKGGQKKRGPKPDSRPPQNLKQARNREAQRTHRERKERYVKALEEEVVLLRSAFTEITAEKTTLQNENRHLKEILRQNGLLIDGFNMEQPLQEMDMSPSSPETILTASSPAQMTTPATTMSTPEMLNNPPSHLPSPTELHLDTSNPLNPHYSRVGLNFVLSLERPCMTRRFAELGFPPPEDPTEPLNFPPQAPQVGWVQRDLDPNADETVALFQIQLADARRKGHLEKLDGEWTPFACWTFLTQSPHFEMLKEEDFREILDIVAPWVKCYGFGAVCEDLVIKEALATVLAKKGIVDNGLLVG